MANDVNLSTFPSDRFDALAMLFLQNQDLIGKTPTEIQTMFFEARKELLRDYQQKRNNHYEFR